MDTSKNDVSIKDIQEMFLLLQNNDIKNLFKEKDIMKLIFDINENQKHEKLLNNSKLANILKNKDLMNNISSLQTKMTKELHNINDLEKNNRNQERLDKIINILKNLGFNEDNIKKEFKLHQNLVTCTSNVLIALYEKKQNNKK
tara:strand:+ start:282 stop:713 length:432 start_codon:yes stop_codon:yes gene_type:complete